MIACLRGELFSRSEEKMIVMAGGVGYELFATSSCLGGLPPLGQQVLVPVYTHVREDALLLYAFADEDEKQIFLHLISVSGVGPRLALTILSAISSAELAHAIGSEAVARLTRLPGVGKKTAERLCLELKDKMQLWAVVEHAGPVLSISEEEALRGDAISALVNLGYPVARAEDAVRRAAAEAANDKLSLEYLIKLALRALA